MLLITLLELSGKTLKFRIESRSLEEKNLVGDEKNQGEHFDVGFC